jgi:hypothetical protein
VRNPVHESGPSGSRAQFRNPSAHRLNEQRAEGAPCIPIAWRRTCNNVGQKSGFINGLAVKVLGVVFGSRFFRSVAEATCR